MIKTCEVEACSGRHHAKGLCQKHYNNLQNHGDPLTTNLRISPGAKIKWLHENASYEGTDCLYWPFSKDNNGYGRIDHNGVGTRAHRVMCQIVHGENPEHKPMALHHCGRGGKGCVNPKHLYWGTSSDNAADALRHGTFVVGEAHHHHKLTSRDVAEIRRLSEKMLQADLAEIYGVTQSAISDVVNRKLWKHIQ